MGPVKVPAGALSAKALGPARGPLDESQLEGNRLIVGCTIDNKIGSQAMIDCGATGFAFIDKQFVSQHNLPCHRLRVSRALQVINGRPVSSGDIAELVRVPPDIGGHKKGVAAFATSLSQYPLVLRIPWLSFHHVDVDYRTYEVRCASRDYLDHCMTRPITVQDTNPTPPPQFAPPLLATHAALLIHRHTTE